MAPFWWTVLETRLLVRYEDSGDSALSLYDILSWRRQLVKELPRLQIHPYAKKTI